MCLAEALLRIPDDATADRLIAEKLAGGDWSAHAGRSDSLFVNASTWALMLTGGLVDLPSELRQDAGGWFRGLARRVGDPIVRQALRRGMRIIGGEFVVGRTISEALARSGREPELSLCSFDMLVKAHVPTKTPNGYLESYRRAILAIGAAGRKIAGGDPHARSSISIKLSALDPRYSLSQRQRVRTRLIPRAMALARLAAREGLALTVDAEEADRLEVSLEVIEALARDAETVSWPGLGLAVQAYGRRAPAVIDWTAQLARESGRRMSVRLVKGAYWDSEIKRAQERGLGEFPVYTRKVSTDVAWLSCANGCSQPHPRSIPNSPRTMRTPSVPCWRCARRAAAGVSAAPWNGATHHDEAQRTVANFPPVRVYAPVGQHADLLAYLVRRLLENGANTSFVNRFMDERVAVKEVVADPITQLETLDSIPHPDIPLPISLYGAARRNSLGVDLGSPAISMRWKPA